MHGALNCVWNLPDTFARMTSQLSQPSTHRTASSQHCSPSLGGVEGFQEWWPQDCRGRQRWHCPSVPTSSFKYLPICMPPLEDCSDRVSCAIRLGASWSHWWMHSIATPDYFLRCFPTTGPGLGICGLRIGSDRSVLSDPEKTGMMGGQWATVVLPLPTRQGWVGNCDGRGRLGPAVTGSRDFQQLPRRRWFPFSDTPASPRKRMPANPPGAIFASGLHSNGNS